ncbi:hypothetical protein [Rhizobium sp. SRDI969]|uniref:hypothetical protein n=1 Tax=Rhizobium sp. SRDI969 TaxID=3138252 RepID=UPI0021A7E12C|nr:hypothetical protein [Rhizobium leguminosarum]UWM80385.1 hypothetical protein N2A41_16970 [Rhizobium leguminosarum bv. viciae]
MQKASFPHYHETMPLQAQENYLRANYLPADADKHAAPKRHCCQFERRGKHFGRNQFRDAAKALLKPTATMASGRITGRSAAHRGLLLFDPARHR